MPGDASYSIFISNSETRTAWSEIFQILPVLVWSGPMAWKFGWSWSGPYSNPAYACYVSAQIFDQSRLTIDRYFISGPRNCTDPRSNLDGDGYSRVLDSCIMKSRLIGYDQGEYFDDLEDLNLKDVNEPMTKMVFWRYTCPRPCLGNFLFCANAGFVNRSQQIVNRSQQTVNRSQQTVN